MWVVVVRGDDGDGGRRIGFIHINIVRWFVLFLPGSRVSNIGRREESIAKASTTPRSGPAVGVGVVGRMMMMMMMMMASVSCKNHSYT